MSTARHLTLVIFFLTLILSAVGFADDKEDKKRKEAEANQTPFAPTLYLAGGLASIGTLTEGPTGIYLGGGYVLAYGDLGLIKGFGNFATGGGGLFFNAGGQVHIFPGSWGGFLSAAAGLGFLDTPATSPVHQFSGVTLGFGGGFQLSRLVKLGFDVEIAVEVEIILAGANSPPAFTVAKLGLYL